MPNQDIEFILARQLSEYLTSPIAIVDHNGRMIYYNESAEFIIGRKYNESGEVEPRDWDERFYEDEGHGKTIKLLDLPFLKVLSGRSIVQDDYWMRNFEEIEQKVRVICIPLVGMAQRELGALVFFNLIQR
jgi:PAS domain-containing protein